MAGPDFHADDGMAAPGAGRGGATPRDRSGVVVVCGLPGTGKTTVARRIAARLDAPQLRTDEIRQELVPEPAYTRSETSMVYGTLLERARRAVERGHPVVLDATFKWRHQRLQASRLADGLDVPFSLVVVEADPTVVRDRIRNRTGDASDADVAVYEELAAAWEPVRLAHEVLDNSGDLDALERELDDRLSDLGLPTPSVPVSSPSD